MEEEQKNITGNDNEPDFLSSVTALDSILQNVTSFVMHIDMQNQIIIGLSSAIFVFSTARFYESGSDVFLLVMSISAGLSAIIALFALHPAKSMRKRGQRESIMYPKMVASIHCSEEYSERLKKVVKDKENIIHEYATDIYNLSKYYYRPKRQLFKTARLILVVGFFLSLMSFIFGL